MKAFNKQLTGLRMEKTEGALVSILMNCYNGEKYLREAIESVLAQTFQNWELIFWDNQSTDQSANIFKSYKDPRLKYFLSPEHTDLGGGRAKAFQHLKGEFIAILDTDDIWFPKKLEKQVPLFEAPEIGIVICDTLFFNEKTEKTLYGKKPPHTGSVFEKLMTNYFVSSETIVFRLSTALKLPRAFDHDFNFISDFDLVVRLSRISKMAFCPDVLAKWRVHGESHSWKYPLTFVEEKERWIMKQVAEDPSFSKQYKKQIIIFNSTNFRDRAVFEIRNNRNRVGAIHNVIKTRFIDWRDWILLVLCFLPFSNIVLSYLLKRKVQII